MSGREVTIGQRIEAKPGDVVEVQVQMASGEHVRGVRCLVLCEGTFDGWVESLRDVAGREPFKWELESARRAPVFFYVATTD